MKIAFLFLIVSNIYHEQCWLNFFGKNQEKYSLYIHSKEPMPANAVFKNFEIPTKIPTTWYNTMQAQIELLREALKDKDNQKFIFVSESTIPLKNFDYVYDYLMSHAMSEFHFFVNPNKRRKFPIKRSLIFKNSQWVILNRKHAELMVQDNDIIQKFSKRPYDNEHYPSTFLKIKGLSSEIKKNDCTLVIWPKGHSPHPITFKDLRAGPYVQQLVQAVKEKKYLFARKFGKTCDLTPLHKYEPTIF